VCTARGFTLIELVVVMALLGLLLSMAMPRYMDSLAKGREKIQAHNIAELREAIDRYHGDRGVYPDRLQDLVDRRYLRAVPLNPVTERADWIVQAPPAGQKGQVYDISAPGAETPNTEGPSAEAAAPDAAASEAQP
jgi:general secretion pathway protein G